MYSFLQVFKNITSINKSIINRRQWLLCPSNRSFNNDNNYLLLCQCWDAFGHLSYIYVPRVTFAAADIQYGLKGLDGSCEWSNFCTAGN